MLQIFDSFQSIAEMVLLFLTSVESIELYRRKHGQVIDTQLSQKVNLQSPSMYRDIMHYSINAFKCLKFQVVRNSMIWVVPSIKGELSALGWREHNFLIF